MIIKYTKQEFQALDFDTRCVIMEKLLTNDYFEGQTRINFYFEEDPVTRNLIAPTPKEQEREEREFNDLLERLETKLFGENDFIELDMEEILK